MPRVKSYRKRDGTFVRAHSRTGLSLDKFNSRAKKGGSLAWLKREDSRYGKVKLDSLSVANIKRYGKPDAFGHKPRLEPVKKGMDRLWAKEFRAAATDYYKMSRLTHGYSRTEYLRRFKEANAAKRRSLGR